MASASVWRSRSVAKRPLYWSRLPRSARMTPLLSVITMFSRRTPSEMYSSAVAMAAAPAPLKTTFSSSIFLPLMSSALSSAAPLITAVPCWSS